VQALCLSALAGNSKIDALKVSSNVTDILNMIDDIVFPYYKRDYDHTKEIKKGKYDEYFKQLNEMEKERSERKKLSDAAKSDSTQQRPTSGNLV
jgi:hypothetical protein